MIELGTLGKGTDTEIRFTLDPACGGEIITARLWLRNATGAYRPGAPARAYRLGALGAVLRAMAQARAEVRQ